MNTLLYIALLMASMTNALTTCNPAGNNQQVVVDPSGRGDFRTIQGAVNSLADSSASPRTIYIKNGTYREKLYVEKANIIFLGESREHTIITASISRDIWRCGHQDDWGVATLNIGANDITLQNLTVVNSYGFDFKEPETIYCASDTAHNKQYTTRKNGHQMALRTMNCTRLKAINCKFSAYAGDTVSPWEVNNGMWYFKDCMMEGGVDFYCPRGWAWAENCEFRALSGTAAIWHDGSAFEDAKTVFKNCRFTGYDNFLLGRYHRDAQFYLIDCKFGSNMRDSNIYLVKTPNLIKWGHRVYYDGCTKEGGEQYAWYNNNLPAGLKKSDITVNWVFKNKWDPTAK